MSKNIPNKAKLNETVLNAGDYFNLMAERLKLQHEFQALESRRYKKPKDANSNSTSELESVILSGGITSGILDNVVKLGQEGDASRSETIQHELEMIDEKISGFMHQKQLAPEIRQEFKFQAEVSIVDKELRELKNLETVIDTKEFDLLRAKQGQIGVSETAQLEKFAKLRTAIQQRKESLALSNETVLAYRASELRRYKEEMSKHRFAETPSREKLLNEVRTLWEQGKNVFLTGPTGTGKTEALVYLGKKLYGESPEVVRCVDRTGPAEIFGKTLLKADTPNDSKIEDINSKIRIALAAYITDNPGLKPEVYNRENQRLLDLYKTQLGVATTTFFQPGRYVTAIDKGKPIIFDEFNLMETKMRMGLKEFYNRKPGDSVVIQEDTGLSHVIQNGFGFAATANLRNAKHEERFKLDDAETRVYNFLEVEYLPKEELYDVMLVKLMDARGGIKADVRQVEYNMKLLVEAFELIQQAYLGTQSNFYEDGGATKKKYAQLEKAVIDPGKALGFLDGYEVASAKGISLMDFIEDQLLRFVKTPDFPEKDRKLLVKIFVSKGFFAGIDPKEFKLPGVDAKELKAFGWKDEKEESQPAVYIPPSKIAQLDPFDVRKAELEKLGEGFLAMLEEQRDGVDVNSLVQKLKNVSKKDQDEILSILESLGSADKAISSTLTPEFFDPSLKRRNTLEQALKAKNLTLEDGFTQNESNNESTLNLEQNEQYWSQFWSAYGISYKKETQTKPDQVKHILEQGYDFFIGIPDISPQQLREICQKEGLKIYQDDRLDLPTLNRANLPTSNYLLALKITQNIAKYEQDGDTQLKTNEINFAQATQIATDLGLKGLTYKEYLIAQLYYFKSTGKYLDEQSWTWLIDQKAPSAGNGAFGDFWDDEVRLYQHDLSIAIDNGGVRLSDIL